VKPICGTSGCSGTSGQLSANYIGCADKGETKYRFFLYQGISCPATVADGDPKIEADLHVYRTCDAILVCREPNKDNPANPCQTCTGGVWTNKADGTTCTLGAVKGACQAGNCVNVPTITITPATATVRTGGTLKITGSSSSTSDLELRCAKQTGSISDFRNWFDHSDPDKIYTCDPKENDKAKPNCTITIDADATTAYCRAFNGQGYSDPAMHITLTIDNDPPTSTIVPPVPANKIQTANFNVAVEDLDNIPSNIAKVLYRTESKGIDTTFFTKDYRLIVKANGKENELTLPSDDSFQVKFRFEISDKKLADRNILIYFSEDMTGTKKITGQAVSGKLLRTCDPPEFNTQSLPHDDKGWRLAPITTDANGVASGEITLCMPPGADLFDAYMRDPADQSKVTLIASSVIRLTPSGTPPRYIWRPRTVSSSFEVQLGAQCPDEGDRICKVVVKAIDKAGNEGVEGADGSYYSYSINIPPPATTSTTIKSPADGSTQYSPGFDVTIEDKYKDVTGVGMTCQYRILASNDGGANYETRKDWTTRPCGIGTTPSKITIPVQKDGSNSCSYAGSKACKIEARSTNNANPPISDTKSIAVNIEFDRPTTTITKTDDQKGWIRGDFDVGVTDIPEGIADCYYQALSAPGPLAATWGNRDCNKLTITVGPNGVCKNDGINACLVYAKSTKGTLSSLVANENFSILTSVVDGTNLDVSTDTSPNGDGLQFTTNTVVDQSSFIICGERTSIAACEAAFSAGNCGYGKPCLCGSLLYKKCTMTCSKRTINYFGVFNGRDLQAGRQTKTISSPLTATCPENDVGTIDVMISEFSLLLNEVTGIANNYKYLCVTRPPSTAQQQDCDYAAAAAQAGKIIADHLKWLNSLKSLAITRAIVDEAKAREQTVIGLVRQLLDTGVPTTLKLEMTIPEFSRINEMVSIPISINKNGNLDLRTKIACTITKPTGGTITSESSCLDPGSLSFTLTFKPDIKDKWGIECKLLSYTDNACSSGYEEDKVSGFTTVVQRLRSSITSVTGPATVPKSSTAQIVVTARNPDAGSVFAIASCSVKDPSSSAATEKKSDCMPLSGGTDGTLTISFPVLATGTWTVNSCKLGISADPACPASSSELDSTWTTTLRFQVLEPTDLIITKVAFPTPVTVDREATADIYVYNPRPGIYAQVGCTASRPSGTEDLISTCEIVEQQQEKKLAMKFTPHVKGIWNIASCTVFSSTDACTTLAPAYTITNAATFTVSGGRLLSIDSVNDPEDIKTGETVQTAVNVKNPTDLLRYGRASCTYRRPDNIQVTNSSVCTSIATGTTTAITVREVAGISGTWTLESCKVDGSANAQCSSATTDDTETVGKTFLATSELIPAGVRFAGKPTVTPSILKGAYARVDITARAVSTGYAIASCSFKTPSSQARTGTSDCVLIQQNTQRSISLDMRADETGIWNVTSCDLMASSGEDCSQTVLSDSMPNIGTFTVSPPSTLIVSRITAKDARTNTFVDVNVTVDNSLQDTKYARVMCEIMMPSGFTVTRISDCAGVLPQSARLFSITIFADQTGTWRINSCSVLQDTHFDCSSAAPVHQANGPSFYVTRNDKMTFASPLSFPSPVRNGTQMVISTTALNPSDSDMFVRMRCILTTQSGKTVNVNNSCFIVPGSDTGPVSIDFTVSEVGLWQLRSCSIYSSLDQSCAGEILQATNSTGGEFISVGLRVLNNSFTGFSSSSNVIRGGTAVIEAMTKNDNEFPEFERMTCTLKNPAGSEETLSSECVQIGTQSVQSIRIEKNVTDLGRWNVTICRLLATQNSGCAAAIQNDNETNVGSFNVVTPDYIIIKRVFGPGFAFNDSTTNITTVVENPIDRKFVSVSCNVTSPSGRDKSPIEICTGVGASEEKTLTFPIYVDEIGTWSINICRLYASDNYNCTGANLNSTATGGTFSVIRRRNLTIIGAGIDASNFYSGSLFNGSNLTIWTSVRNPSDTDLFGRVACTLRSGTNTRQNSSSCRLFSKNSLTTVNLQVLMDTPGNWTADECSVYGSLEQDCDPSSVHDRFFNAGYANVIAIPDISVADVLVSGEITRNTTTNASASVRVSLYVPVFAQANCTITSPARSITAASACQQLDANSQNLYLYFTPDRLGNWSISSCAVYGSSRNCSQLRLQNVSNIVRTFNVTGRVLQITDVFEPSDDLKLNDRGVVSVKVKNVDTELHHAFVNCTLRKPGGTLLLLQSSTLTIGVGETKLFELQFTANPAGNWRLSSCVAFRIDSPAFQEDTWTGQKDFSVATIIQPPPGRDTCSVSGDCPGTDLSCFCSQGQCMSCPAGSSCSQNSCVITGQNKCRYDTDCPVDKQCSGGECIAKPSSGCITNTDCASGFECSGGRCVAAKPPENGDMTVIIFVIVIAVAIAALVAVIIRRRMAADEKEILSRLGRERHE
jgi:hypothetical protein